jgi:hypothetical protein
MSGAMCAYAGASKPRRIEELQVQRHAGDPLLARMTEVDPHEVVVDGVREVVRRQPRAGVGGLEEDDVVVVRLVLQPAADDIRPDWSARRARGRAPGT